MQPLCFVHTLEGEPFMLLNINLSPAKTNPAWSVHAENQSYITAHTHSTWMNAANKTINTTA